MDDSYEPTIQQLLDVAKRVMGNGINWRFVREASAMPLADLVAMSVGLEGVLLKLSKRPQHRALTRQLMRLQKCLPIGMRM
jgi:hypothetical protein